MNIQSSLVMVKKNIGLLYAAGKANLTLVSITKPTYDESEKNSKLEIV